MSTQVTSVFIAHSCRGNQRWAPNPARQTTAATIGTHPIQTHHQGSNEWTNNGSHVKRNEREVQRRWELLRACVPEDSLRERERVEPVRLCTKVQEAKTGHRAIYNWQVSGFEGPGGTRLPSVRLPIPHGAHTASLAARNEVTVTPALADLE